MSPALAAPSTESLQPSSGVENRYHSICSSILTVRGGKRSSKPTGHSTFCFANCMRTVILIRMASSTACSSVLKLSLWLLIASFNIVRVICASTRRTVCVMDDGRVVGRMIVRSVGQVAYGMSWVVAARRRSPTNCLVLYIPIPILPDRQTEMLATCTPAQAVKAYAAHASRVARHPSLLLFERQTTKGKDAVVTRSTNGGTSAMHLALHLTCAC